MPNLYRLDPSEPMDPLWRTLRGERGALRVAKRRAIRRDTAVLVSKIDGRTLRVIPHTLVLSDGTTEKAERA